MRAVRNLVGLMATCLLLAGCSADESSSEPAASPTVDPTLAKVEDAISAGLKATDAQQRYRVRGTLDVSKPPVEFEIQRQGDNCQGSMKLGKDGSFDLRVVGDQSYFQPDRKYIVAKMGGKKFIESFTNKWVAGGDDELISAACSVVEDFSERLGALATGASDDVDVSITKQDEIGGKQSELYILEGDSTARVWVALDEPRTIQRLWLSDFGEMGMYDQGTKVKIRKPKAASIVQN